MPDTPIKPTDEQQTIVDAVAASQSSIMISAYAGTAKTSTLTMAAPGVKEPALALAFNKRIATELSGKLPENFKVQTLNGLGHGAWLRTMDRPSVKLDDRKLGKLVSAVAKEQKLELLSWQWDAVREAVKEAMQQGLSPNNIGQPLIQDTEESWDSLIDVPSQDDIPIIRDLAREVLITSIGLARQGHISFDDQIYCPTILGGKWPLYPRVFVDEAQDLSPLNHRMLALCTRPDGLITGVGDERQAIYQFRGADAKSMKNMRGLRPSWEDFPLTMTFRCPKVVVERQQDHAPGYRAAPTNIDGRFLIPDISNGSVLDGWSWNWIKSKLDGLPSVQGPPIAILCRNNAPLLGLAFKLIRSGVGCQMLGRDIGRGIIRLSKKLGQDDAMEIKQFSIVLSEWLERETSLSQINDKPERASKIQDQADCLRATIEGASPRTSGELRLVLERLFSREGSQIILSSCHRAKGLEWPLVIHLDPWRIPSKQAKMANLLGDPLPLEQEYNLLYVAETRTKHTLVNANLESFS